MPTAAETAPLELHLETFFYGTLRDLRERLRQGAVDEATLYALGMI
ncbi:hypothetical protein BH20VER2_BH20VER2_08120 [soil metagenome]